MNSVTTDRIIMDALSACGNDSPEEKHKHLMKALLSVIELNPECEEAACLSNQEKRCLFWIAHGKNSKEICELMKIQVSTLNTYIKRLKFKLKSKTLANLVFKTLCYRPKNDQKKIFLLVEAKKKLRGEYVK